MKKYFLLIGIIGCITVFSNNRTQAQIVDGAFKRAGIENRKPMPFASVREADIMWSKKIWRIIDLREKMNQVLYYPTTNMDGRTNLINLLLEGIQNGQLTAYDARTDDEFKVPMTFEQVKEAFGATTRTRKFRNLDTGEFEERTIVGEIRPEEVKQFMIKEEWYFDKKNSTMNVRIIGICPIQEFYRDEDINHQTPVHRQVFWIYYPEARPLLANHAVINPRNTAQDMSFDDLLVKRQFNSSVVKESNVYNNRAISQYLTGRAAMEESKRIEQQIFNFEQDLWQY